MSKIPILALGVGLAAGFAAGCQKAEERTTVRGTVRFDGKPIRSGRIMFDPDGAKGNNGRQGVAKITDGRFDTTAEGSHSPGPGAVVVRVYGCGQPSKDFPNGVPLFDEYQTTADLPHGEATVDFDVPFSARENMSHPTPVNP